MKTMNKRRHDKNNKIVFKKHLFTVEAPMSKHEQTPIIREAGSALILKPWAHLLCLAPSQQPPWPL